MNYISDMDKKVILDLSVDINKSNRNNNPLLPKSIRGCIIGKSYFIN